jgi:hypothetical protein
VIDDCNLTQAEASQTFDDACLPFEAQRVAGRATENVVRFEHLDL